MRLEDPLTGANLFNTVLFIGCNNAKGQPADPLPPNWEPTIVNAIWGEFIDFKVLRVEDGKCLWYWGQGEDTRDNYWTHELLRDADGKCQAWANLFIDCLKAQGINAQFLKAEADLTVTPDAEGILIKNWDFSGPGGQQQHAPFVYKIGEDAEDLNGLPGQGKDPNRVPPPTENVNPYSVFEAHFLVLYTVGGNEYYFDPSYGRVFNPPDANEDWETNMFSGSCIEVTTGVICVKKDDPAVLELHFTAY